MRYAALGFFMTVIITVAQGFVKPHPQEGLVPSVTAVVDPASVRSGSKEIKAEYTFKFICSKATSTQTTTGGQPLVLDGELEAEFLTADYGFGGAGLGFSYGNFKERKFTISEAGLLFICGHLPGFVTLKDDAGNDVLVRLTHQGKPLLEGAKGFLTTFRFKIALTFDEVVSSFNNFLNFNLNPQNRGSPFVPLVQAILNALNNTGHFPDGMQAVAKGNMTSPDPRHNIAPAPDTKVVQ